MSALRDARIASQERQPSCDQVQQPGWQNGLVRIHGIPAHGIRPAKKCILIRTLRTLPPLTALSSSSEQADRYCCRGYLILPVLPLLLMSIGRLAVFADPISSAETIAGGEDPSVGA